jgi:hypothetical protein
MQLKLCVNRRFVSGVLCGMVILNIIIHVLVEVEPARQPTKYHTI